MIANVSERLMLTIRSLIAISWLLLIVSFIFDSFLISHQERPIDIYIFWITIASVPFVLLVFGHETWRRICPLSLIGQLPRIVGVQWKKSSGGVLIQKDSFLDKNHLYLQFVFLVVGIMSRAIFMNSDRVLLGSFLLLVIISSLIVGFLYGGKSWCNYFCPMSPVQKFYSSPGGLLESSALNRQGEITKSTCREVSSTGVEKSSCVGCKTFCPDIDLELNYWKEHDKPGQKLIYFGYPGLLIGFYLFQWLSLKSWSAVLHGEWTKLSKWGHQNDILYQIGNFSINRWVAAVSIISICIALSYIIFTWIESEYLAVLVRKGVAEKKLVDAEPLRHKLYVLSVWISFNLFYYFGQAAFSKIPFQLGPLISSLMLILSTIWMWKSIHQSSYDYTKASLAESLKKQLKKLEINFANILEGKSFDDLKVDEIYMLTKTVSALTGDNRKHIYRDILKDAFKNGQANPQNSSTTLKHMRMTLNISDLEHAAILTEMEEVGEITESELNTNTEDLLRSVGYKQAVRDLLNLRLTEGKSIQTVMHDEATLNEIIKLQNIYNIYSSEKLKIIEELQNENAEILNKIQGQLEQLQVYSLNDFLFASYQVENKQIELKLLRKYFLEKKSVIVFDIMRGLIKLGDTEQAASIARATYVLAPIEIEQILASSFIEDGLRVKWIDQLLPRIYFILISAKTEDSSLVGIAHKLPHCDVNILKDVLAEIVNDMGNAILQVLASRILKNFAADTASEVVTPVDQKIEALLALESSSFFSQFDTTVLENLAKTTQVKKFNKDEIIQKAGVSSQFIWILYKGDCSGLDELHEVLARGSLSNTLVSLQDDTYMVALPVNSLELVVGKNKVINSLAHKLSLANLGEAEKIPVVSAGSEVEILIHKDQHHLVFYGRVEEISKTHIWISVHVGYLKQFNIEIGDLKTGCMTTIVLKQNDDSRIYGFYSMINQRHPSVAGMFQFSAAQSVNRMERRQFMRIDCGLKGYLSSLSGDIAAQDIACELIEIGGGGAKVILKESESWKLGNLVDLRFSMSKGSFVKVIGKFLNFQHMQLADGRNEFSASLKFVKIDSVHQSEIIHYVYQELLKIIHAGHDFNQKSSSGFKKFIIDKKVDEGGSVMSFYLKPMHNNLLPTFRPGQFLTFQFDIDKVETKNKTKNRPIIRCYSLSDSPGKEYYRISVKRAPSPKDKPEIRPGLSSNFLHDKVNVGSIIEVKSPSGSFYLDINDPRPVVLIGGGIGITPVLSMLNYCCEHQPDRKIWFFLGVRNTDDHVFKLHLEECAKSNPNLNLNICYASPNTENVAGVDFQHKGYVSADLIKQQVPDLNCHYYLCGPPPFMQSITDGLKTIGIPSVDVRFEAFGPASVKAADNTKIDIQIKSDAIINYGDDSHDLPWDATCKTLLELAEKNDIQLASGCRVGNCHTCKMEVLEGEVSYIKNTDALPTPEHCLVCIAVPKTNLKLGKMT